CVFVFHPPSSSQESCFFEGMTWIYLVCAEELGWPSLTTSQSPLTPSLTNWIISASPAMSSSYCVWLASQAEKNGSFPAGLASVLLVFPIIRILQFQRFPIAARMRNKEPLLMAGLTSHSCRPNRSPGSFLWRS